MTYDRRDAEAVIMGKKNDPAGTKAALYLSTYTSLH